MNDSVADGFFVQVVITAPQAAMIAAFLDTDRDPSLRSQLEGLSAFFTDVAGNPRSYPVTGRYAKSIKTRKRMLKRLAR